LNFLPYCRADAILAQQMEFGRRHLAESGFDQFRRSGRRIYTQGFAPRGDILLKLNARVFDAGFGQGGSHGGFSRFLLESHQNRIPAAEFGTEGCFSPPNGEDYPHHNNDPGDGKGVGCQFQEIYLLGPDKMQHGQGFEPTTVREEVED